MITNDLFLLNTIPSNPSKPIVTSSSNHNYNNPDGQIYAIVGTGGINLHGLSGKSSFISSQQDTKFGILDIKITNGVTNLTQSFMTILVPLKINSPSRNLVRMALVTIHLHL